jgi:dimethylglycine dehydrogenase
MAGLERFIDYDRPGFIGRDAALRDRETAPARRLVSLTVEAHDADASGYEPIMQGKEVVGFVTSGGYGHCTQTSLAMGYLDSAVASDQSGLTITVLGEARPCRILSQPIYDSSGARMRG